MSDSGMVRGSASNAIGWRLTTKHRKTLMTQGILDIFGVYRMVKRCPRTDQTPVTEPATLPGWLILAILGFVVGLVVLGIAVK